MNKTLSTVLVTLTLVSAPVLAKKIPEWVSSTPAGQSVYCVPAGANIDMARKVALQFASEDQGRGFNKVDVSGSESAKTIARDGAVDSQYNMNTETIATGMKKSVQLLDEAMVDGSLCVLVK
ncbi:hypothetical protein P3602_24505 [Vibrio parahaemolyticus]|uniref:hypothetical protein n=1 Tax=Vibrio TaxID=662 RepID=UPI001B81DE85|nr:MULTISPECIES: hypothetical protein [Vibrio]MDF5109082.1 hypothetical protein [Vibrio parahaemolyticus]MCA2420929.1 hypothetical protein [Vibrio alginolyticus]MCA2445704.1 hypothetical protein [Vibrio alginolyticus]MDF5143980.1 hypothetical protein [Vibrio parahaemolyticus]MDF5154407.1 hypothetical protein [Vibrio parahaemolyticus]